MIDSLSMCLARLGKISEICTPGAFVEMGLKPVFPFTSQLSRWLIPPSSQTRMTACALAGRWDRSEEHTSELQSRGHLVCRLLLEKKKQYRQQSCWKHSYVLT